MDKSQVLRAMMNGDISLERRLLPFSISQDLEKRDEKAGKVTLSGLATPFGKEAKIWWFYESMRKGAFEETIKEGDQRALVNHNTDLPLASTNNKTLRLWETDEGLRCEIDLNLNVSYAKDLYENVQSGLIDKMSIGFQVLRQLIINEEDSDDGFLHRIIVKAKLWETSPVTFPAYKETELFVLGGKHKKPKKRNLYNRSNYLRAIGRGIV